jgi:alpha-D-ribose 1-methylphosphonate 5-triphosphate synthase subunit PhnL
MIPILEVRNLSKTFILHNLNNKKIEALTDVNFSINQGEVVGLTGKSGSGKSTLIKSIYRTYLATSGEMVYHSKKYGLIDLVKASQHKIIDLRRNEITYCSQFLKVIPRVTAIDIVAENIIKKEADRPMAREEAKELINALGLPRELWDSYPMNFSGGEQQRINIARAIIAKPRFLLVDEPTASLDQKTKDVVIRLILDLKQYGTSVLCITHDNYTLESLTDKNIHLQEGTILEEEYAAR